MVYGYIRRERLHPTSERTNNRIVPYTAMGLLIVYCLKDVNIVGASHGLPEFIALAIVVVSYLLKKNTILSVVIGTITYMVMVRMIF